MSDSPRDPTDVRDEGLAARLAVEPLDDVTRARLVRNAMDASAEAAPTNEPARRSGRSRWLAVAAALVVVLAVGLAVVLRDDSGSEPTAARAPKTGASQSESASPNAADSSGLDRTFSTNTGIRPLGDLGDVGSNPQLRRAVTAAGADAPSASTLSELDAQATATPAAAAPCVIKPRGKIVASGSGTAQGETVTVYVVERPSGSRVAVAVGPNCTIGKPVKL